MRIQYIILGFALLFGPAIISAKNNIAKHSGKIEAYFKQYLTNGSVKHSFKSVKIGIEDIEDARNEVWQVWKTVNVEFEEDKLIALAELNSNSVGRWELPMELEPNAVLKYRYGYLGEKPEDGYPAYLYLHGSGPKKEEWEIGLQLCQRFNVGSAVYLIPQIPNIGSYYRWWQRAKVYAWNKWIRLTMLNDAIDPNRIYIFGISEGGYGSQRLASFYADYLAAAGPMAGGEPLKNAPVENCSNIAFSLRTGEQDYGFYRNKLTGYVKDEYNRLAQEHSGLFLNWIEHVKGRGHSIDYGPTPMWLSKFKRNARPKHFYWEDFAMDTVCRRNGFYNLEIVERPVAYDEDSRTLYEMKIENNVVDLIVNHVEYETIEKDKVYNIDLKFKKRYSKANSGKWKIYLSEDLVDLRKKVIVRINGKKVFCGKLKPNVKEMVRSVATFFDPERIFPVAVEVSID